MFRVNDDLSICATRGDAGGFYVTATIGGEPYTFRSGDVVRFKVFGKKSCGDIALQKDVTVAEDTTQVEIFLNGGETRFCEVISKPVDYRYEVELNPETKELFDYWLCLTSSQKSAVIQMLKAMSHDNQ
mgnify:CR=1 FL=1